MSDLKNKLKDKTYQQLKDDPDVGMIEVDGPAVLELEMKLQDFLAAEIKRLSALPNANTEERNPAVITALALGMILRRTLSAVPHPLMAVGLLALIDTTPVSAPTLRNLFTALEELKKLGAMALDTRIVGANGEEPTPDGEPVPFIQSAPQGGAKC